MLTDKSIRSAKPRASAYRIFDKGSDRGFGIKILPSGTKQFFLQFKDFAGKVRYLKLGDFGTSEDKLDLEAARKECRAQRALIEKQVDPTLERERKREAEVAEKQRRAADKARLAATATIADLLTSYVGSQRKVATAAEIRQTFEKNVVPYIGAKYPADVTELDIEDILDRVRTRGAPTVARNLHGYLHAAFEHGISTKRSNGKGFCLERNPCAGVKKPDEPPPGERALSDDEIRLVWESLDESGMGLHTRSAVRLLLLTGARVQEILGASWSELDRERRLLDMPSARVKTGAKTRRGFVVPLTQMAMEIINSLPVLGEAMFPKKGSPNEAMPFRSLSQAIDRLCARSDGAIASFSPRDIRRTVKTGMARIGVPMASRNLIQNHALHDVASVHYDRHDHAPEKRAGLTAWEWEIKRILAGKPATDDWHKWASRLATEPFNDLPGRELQRTLHDEVRDNLVRLSA
jgi:integrase